MFKHIKLITKSSNWVTCINPDMSNEDIQKAFLNKFYDVGVYPVEKIERCEKVLFLYSASFDGCKLGAIGGTEFFKDIRIYSKDELQAEFDLYNHYEHLSNVVIIQVME